MFATRPSAAPRTPNRFRSALAAAFALLALLVLLVLTGCGGMNASGGQSAEAPADAPGEGARGEPAPDDDAQAAAPGAEGGSGVEGAAGEDGASGVADVPVAQRDLVHTADLAVEVDDVQKAAGAAADWTESAGGYVAAENVQTAEGSPPHASLTLHVPQKRYEDALKEFSKLGSRSSLDRQVEDVTGEVADVDSRVESAEESLERLRGLLDEAESVEDVLAIEEQISTRQEDLEALQARQKSLAQQTTYGTVRLELAPPETYVQEPQDDDIGFLGGLQRGWQALVTVARFLLVVFGWLLPFLLVAAVAATPAWLAWRRRRRSAAGRAARRRVPAAPVGEGAAASPETGPVAARTAPAPDEASPGEAEEDAPGDTDTTLEPADQRPSGADDSSGDDGPSGDEPGNEPRPDSGR